MKKNKPKTLLSLSKTINSQNSKIKQLKAKLAMSSAAFLHVVGKSSDGVIIIDKQKMVVYTNYAAMQIFDKNLVELLGEPLAINFDLLPLEHYNEPKELSISKSSGGNAIVEVSVLKTEWNNEACYVLNFRDITERKNSEKMLEYIATHDYLTDLPNRIYFEKQVENAISYAQNNKQHMAVIYLDLDNFKTINDTFGHTVGDHILKEVSALLLQSIRQGDTVARLGGDEFAISLNTLRKPDYAAIVSQTILDKLRKFIRIEGKDIFINASIGIAVYPFCGSNAETLLKNADIGMYAAKSYGKNQYRYFTKELSQQSEQNIYIVNGLRNVIQNQELRLQYQPIIDLNTLQCSGIETLVRWQHPQLGLILPEKFLPNAEEIGAMVDMGCWIFNQALDDFDKLKYASSLFLTLNMSSTEFTAKDIDHFILSSIKQRAISYDQLVIELTETVIMQHPELTIEKIKNLSSSGARFAIDDFGVGYSSLNLLKQLPINILKIDKSFIDGILKSSNDTIIVISTIQLGHNLGLKVIAEGVETKEQLAFLKEHGCDYAQGYYFSKPLYFKQLEQYLG